MSGMPFQSISVMRCLWLLPLFGMGLSQDLLKDYMVQKKKTTQATDTQGHETQDLKWSDAIH